MDKSSTPKERKHLWFVRTPPKLNALTLTQPKKRGRERFAGGTAADPGGREKARVRKGQRELKGPQIPKPWGVVGLDEASG